MIVFQVLDVDASVIALLKYFQFSSDFYSRKYLPVVYYEAVSNLFYFWDLRFQQLCCTDCPGLDR